MKHFFFLLIIILFTANIQAKCRKQCQVSYSTSSGWSKKYSLEVTFLTGWELNTSTKTFNYSMNDVYAVIFWEENSASVIKLNSILICGTEVNCSCINNNILDLKGKDQKGDEWKICTSDLICP